MRKFILGAIFGFLLAFAFPVYAEISSYVGKKVTNEYTVVVNGVELEQKAVAVGGRSFTPNRALADAVGYDVVFDAENKKVIFTKKSVDQASENSNSTEGFASEENGGEDGVQTYPYTLDQINTSIEMVEHQIINMEKGIKKAEELGDFKQAEALREHIRKLQNDLERYKQIKAELEAQQQK